VLRSNALNTGQNALRLWAARSSVRSSGPDCSSSSATTAPCSGSAPRRRARRRHRPRRISFAAGQRPFTVTLVILFNIGQNPTGTFVLLRIQDIALGCAVSVLVGLFFWPRGAAAAVDRALSAAYTESARYLADAVEYAASRCSIGCIPTDAPLEAGRQAAGRGPPSRRRLRSYLAERGAKPVRLSDMTTLVTGIVGLRLASDAVLELWQRNAGEAHIETRPVRGPFILLDAVGRVSGWYRDLAAGLGRNHRRTSSAAP